jgi:DNA-binding PadR family transcriptional regulator
MARNPSAPSRIEVLLLGALARAPMHGYELKLELRYKHVEWWAKCDHGHLYAALTRLEQARYIKQVRRAGGRATQRVFAITAAGRKRLLDALEQLAARDDTTYFDIDVFLSACHLLDREHVLALLEARRAAVAAKAVAADELEQSMRPYVPPVGRLIMEHRVGYLHREEEFLGRCVEALRAQPGWGSFLAGKPIEEFIRATGVPLEEEHAEVSPSRGATPRAGRRPRSAS